MSEKKASVSQRLYQVYYLGERAIDRRYSSTVIPWIIEELKLNLEHVQDLRRAWLTQGPQRVVFVAEAGEEFVKTNYRSILCCTTGHDGVSFGYTAVDERSGKISCHVFQSLDLDEAELICENFKAHSVAVNARYEPNLLSNAAILAANKSLTKNNKKKKVYRTRSSGSQQPTTSDDAGPSSFSVIHCGSMTVNHRQVNSEVIDCLVSILSASPQDRDGTTAEKRARWKMRKRSHTAKTNSMFREDSTDKDSVDGVGSLDSMDSSSLLPTLNLSMNDTSGDRVGVIDEEQVVSSIVGSQERFREPLQVSRCVSLSLPQSKGGWRSGDSESSGSESPAPGRQRSPAISIPGRSSSSPIWRSGASVEERYTNGSAAVEDFDHISELVQLRHTPDFTSLNLTDHAPRIRQLLSDSQPAILTVTELELVIATHGQEDGDKEVQEIIRTRLQLIFSCSQGYSSAEYVGFLTRTKGTTTYIFHLLKTDSKKTASAVIKSFKHGFERCITAALPNSICQNCPIYSMNQLCQSLVGLPTNAAHSRVQEFLLTSGDSELVRGNKQIEPFENDHGQLVRWVGVIRSVINMKQEEHIHSPFTAKPCMEKGAEIAPAKEVFDRKKFQERPSSADKVRKGRRLLVLRSTLASSLENIRHVKKTDAGDELSSTCTGSATGTLEPSASSTVSVLVGHASDTVNLPSSSVFSRRKSGDKNSTAGPDATSEGPFSLNKGKKSPFDRGTKLYSSNRKQTELGSPSTSNEDVAATCSNGNESTTSVSPMRGHRRTMSLRQQIFESVVGDKENVLGRSSPLQMDMMGDAGSAPHRRNFSAQKSIQEIGSEELTPAVRSKMRWKWAIEQQLLLLKLEKENQSLIDASIAAIQRQKLDYSNPDLVNEEEARKVWETLLSEPSPSDKELVSAVKKGIPPMLRGQAWHLLTTRYAAKYGPFYQKFPSDSEFTSDFMQQLLEEPSELDHIIKADISRTYPTHPYFARSEGPGQAALYEVLHAYSNVDKEVGYCQGLGFVAGQFIMHCDDALSALKILCRYMYYYQMRTFYYSNMDELKMRIYQFTRLLYDWQPNLHAHLSKHEVVPMLFATSWFLTLFSAKFPIPFVSRVFDFFFLEGIQALFKVALSLMRHFECDMLALPDMESLGLFLNKDIHKLSSEQSTRVLQSVWQMPDLVAKLETFETEYRVMLELRATFNKNWMDMSDLESRNKALSEQNDELIQQLALCRGAIMRQEIATSVLQRLVDKQQDRLERFEAELSKERKERLDELLKNERRWKKLRQSMKSKDRLSASSDSLVDVDIDINESSTSSENM